MLQTNGRIPVRRHHLVAIFVFLSLLLTGTLILEGVLGQREGSQSLEIQASE